jgi:hypothetical protein
MRLEGLGQQYIIVLSMYAPFEFRIAKMARGDKGEIIK